MNIIIIFAFIALWVIFSIIHRKRKKKELAELITIIKRWEDLKERERQGKTMRGKP